VFQTISRYLGVVLDKELILSEQENLKAQRQQLARIEEFYKAGNRPVADVLQQKASIAQAELRLLAAERSYDVGKLELLRTMGLEATVDYEVAGLPIEQMASDLVSRPPDQLVVSESAKRPDFQAQELRIDAASEQVRAARSGYWPALSLSASAGSDYASRSHAGGFSDQFFDSNPNAQIGVSLSIPLFDRYETKHNVAQAQVQLANERLDLEDLKQQISFEVQQAVLDYQTATKELDVAEAQLGFARQALEAAEGRYNVGASTLVELAQSRAQYVAAVNGRVKARYSLLLGRVAVDYYQGDLNRMLALFE
jgi:outer membrane protein